MTEKEELLCKLVEELSQEVTELRNYIKLISSEPKKTAHNSDKTICPSCKGKGYYYIEGYYRIKDHSNKYKCKACNGTGHIV